MSVALSRTCVALALALGPRVALAESPTDNFPQIDSCIDAAQVTSGAVESMIAMQSRNASLDCGSSLRLRKTASTVT
jgi:hypothetical protein